MTFFFFYMSYLILSVLLVNVFLDEVQKCKIFGLETAMWVRLFWAPRWRHRYFHTVHSIQVTHKARYFGLKKKKTRLLFFHQISPFRKAKRVDKCCKIYKMHPSPRKVAQHTDLEPLEPIFKRWGTQNWPRRRIVASKTDKKRAPEGLAGSALHN